MEDKLQPRLRDDVSLRLQSLLYSIPGFVVERYKYSAYYQFFLPEATILKQLPPRYSKRLTLLCELP